MLSKWRFYPGLGLGSGVKDCKWLDYNMDCKFLQKCDIIIKHDDSSYFVTKLQMLISFVHMMCSSRLIDSRCYSCLEL